MSFDHIRIEHPSCLKIKELYNVPKEKWRSRGSTTIVDEFECDGYLGMLFESERVEEKECKTELKFLFCDEDGTPLEEIDNEIVLFRPKIRIGAVHEKITVNLPSRFIDKRISVENIGFGTLLIIFKTPPSSEIQKKQPAELEAFDNVFRQVLETDLLLVKREFPQYTSYINDFCSYIRTARGDLRDEKIEEIEIFLRDFREIVENDPSFQEVFSEAFSNAIIKNVHLLGLVQRLADYFDSIQGRRIILINPTEIIEIGMKPKKLDLQIQTYDIMLGKLETITCPSMTIKAKQKGKTKMETVDLPLHKLFEWK